MTHTLIHPLLGPITGLAKPETVQFLGVPYARLAHRFAAPTLCTDYGGSLDATTFGPSVIAPPGGCDLEFDLIQCPLPKPVFPGMSDVDGLHLNISVPTAATPPAGGFPVVVFIHGGGMMLGGNWWPQADWARLVALSGRLDTPIIGVGIGYRVGVCGFLDSAQMRSHGCPPNRGLLDQQAAFGWLRRNISGFGGNPDAITAMGQSAGSLSVLIHLDAPEALFQRAVCLSGTPLALPLFTATTAQASYAQVVAVLGLTDAADEAQVDGLLHADPGDLLTKIPLSVPLGPIVDEDGAVIVRPPASFAALVTPAAAPHPWCQALMIGAASLDASVLVHLGLFAGRHGLAAALRDTLANAPGMAAADVEALLQGYGIRPDTDDAEARPAILRLLSDLQYVEAAQVYASHWRGMAYLYYLREPNPWAGPDTPAGATHVQDVALLFQNYNDMLAAAPKAVANALAADVCAFASGQQPYLRVEETGMLRQYGGGNDRMVGLHKAGPSVETRSLWDKLGRDNLSRGCQAFLHR